MGTEEQSIPAERPYCDEAIQACLIPAPCVRLLEELLPGSHVMKKNHQDNFNRRRQLQLPGAQAIYVVDRL